MRSHLALGWGVGKAYVTIRNLGWISKDIGTKY